MEINCFKAHKIGLMILLLLVIIYVGMISEFLNISSETFCARGTVDTSTPSDVPLIVVHINIREQVMTTINSFKEDT
jgi:hypothetical protein